jgi:hypothetical protein
MRNMTLVAVIAAVAVTGLAVTAGPPPRPPAADRPASEAHTVPVAADSRWMVEPLRAAVVLVDSPVVSPDAQIQLLAELAGSMTRSADDVVPTYGLGIDRSPTPAERVRIVRFMHIGHELAPPGAEAPRRADRDAMVAAFAKILAGWQTVVASAVGAGETAQLEAMRARIAALAAAGDDAPAGVTDRLNELRADLIEREAVHESAAAAARPAIVDTFGDGRLMLAAIDDLTPDN